VKRSFCEQQPVELNPDKDLKEVILFYFILILLKYKSLKKLVFYIIYMIKECDLQLYEGGPLSFSSESQTEETSFEYDTK